MQQFQVDKTQFAKAAVVNSEQDNALQAGQIRVKIEQFAFTANNITYAAAGDLLGYWRFFPPLPGSAANAGVIPVWGFAEVVESQHEDVNLGERLFGYFPPATELVMQPTQVSEGRVFDGSAHRAELPQGYNMYRRVNNEPSYDASLDKERMLLWPLYITSFCLWDYLTMHQWYQAKQIVVLSASSKTSVGLAYALNDDENAPKVIGVTSSRNQAVVSDLDLYDEVLNYEAISTIDNSLPTVIVDMSGNSDVLGQLHGHLGDNMAYCINVGVTHWDAGGAHPDIIQARSEFFFAPGHIQTRVKEWGAKRFDEQSTQFITRTAARSRQWLRINTVAGLEGLAQQYPDICTGQLPPDEGVVIKM